MCERMMRWGITAEEAKYAEDLVRFAFQIGGPTPTPYDTLAAADWCMLDRGSRPFRLACLELGLAYSHWGGVMTLEDFEAGELADLLA